MFSFNRLIMTAVSVLFAVALIWIIILFTPLVITDPFFIIFSILMFSFGFYSMINNSSIGKRITKQESDNMMKKLKEEYDFEQIVRQQRWQAATSEHSTRESNENSDDIFEKIEEAKVSMINKPKNTFNKYEEYAHAERRFFRLSKISAIIANFFPFAVGMTTLFSGMMPILNQALIFAALLLLIIVFYILFTNAHKNLNSKLQALTNINLQEIMKLLD